MLHVGRRRRDAKRARGISSRLGQTRLCTLAGLCMCPQIRNEFLRTIGSGGLIVSALCSTTCAQRQAGLRSPKGDFRSKLNRYRTDRNRNVYAKKSPGAGSGSSVDLGP